jgi:cytoskeletal protein CcmA (bactofilin family)
VLAYGPSASSSGHPSDVVTNPSWIPYFQTVGPKEDSARGPNLGRSISIKGEVSGSEDLTIDGQVEGRIDLPEHVMTVGPNATIVADNDLRYRHRSVTAREKIEVRKTGSVEGQLTCARLVVQEGALLTGKVDAKGDRRAAVPANVKAA